MGGANTVSAWVVIERPILDVFNYVMDPWRLPEWVAFYRTVRPPKNWDMLDEPRSFEVEFYPAPYPLVETVTCLDIVPGRSITFKSAQLPQTATYLFEPHPQGTHLTAHHSPVGPQAVSPFQAFVRPWGEHILQTMLLQLKLRLEAMKLKPTPHRIFFSYRRAEDDHVGGRVYDALTREFGEVAVFRDIYSIEGGDDFEARIQRAIEDCGVVVAFIGPNWRDRYDTLEKEKRDWKKRQPKRGQRKKNGRQSEEPRDWVVEELKAAINLGPEKATIIPVIASGVVAERRLKHPAEIIPRELHALLKRQFRTLRPDPDFRTDMERVKTSIWRAIFDRDLINRRKRRAD